MTLCSIDGCNKNADRKDMGRAGLCRFHYIRRTPEKYEYHLFVTRKRTKEWHQKNPEGKKEYYRIHKTHLNDIKRRHKEEKKMIIFNHYTGGKMQCMCECGCNVSHLKLLTIDHINSDGINDRPMYKGNKLLESIIERGFPPIYQILCYNCNLGRARNNRICPLILL